MTDPTRQAEFDHATENGAAASPVLDTAEACALYVAGDAAHDFDHVLRVTRLAERIAVAEGADVQTVRLAALLHDVPVTHLDDAVLAALGVPPLETSTANARLAHHLVAADFAQALLWARGLDAVRVANVVHCIRAHRFRDTTIRPATLEAQCLYDADKLDSIGAIGVARAFAFAGAHGSRLWTEPWTDAPPDTAKPTGDAYTPVHEYVYKLQRLQATLFTDTARSLAAHRHAFMVEFFTQLDAEMSGEA